MTDYAGILSILKRDDRDLFAVFRTGSRVYGTATAASDEDFVAVLSQKDAKRDLVFRPGINIITQGQDSFREAIGKHSVFALESLFLPLAHVLKAPRPPIPFRLDKKKLATSAIERSTSDFAKAKKCFDGEPEASKKKLFHSLRVPMFALQIARRGRIEDYGEANPLWREITASESLDFSEYEAKYGGLRERLCKELEGLSGKR